MEIEVGNGNVGREKEMVTLLCCILFW